MSRALRYAPPVADRRSIVRPRLLSELRTRFDRPLMAIVAPAGFGKTTLLAQAVRENALSPLGQDHWLTCQRDDVSLSFLASGTFAAVGLHSEAPDDPREAAAAAAEAIWSAAPQHVSLIFDDAHMIRAESPGSHFLAALVEELPLNGHVVLASRPPPPLRLSRLMANGDAVLLQERDMQFRDDEVATFAQLRGVSYASMAEVGGWPALAELTASVGSHAVTGYVWDELLTQLTPERRHALAVLSAVGGGDQEIAEALLGEDIDLAGVVDGLPLVIRSASGWRSLHALWASALQHHLDRSEVADARRIAGRLLAGRRQYHDAMDLLLDAEAWDDVRDVIVTVCEVCTPLVPPDVLQTWLDRLPEQIARTPEGLLLSAMIVEPASPYVAESLLEQSLTAAPPTARVRYACLNALVQLAFWRADRARMMALTETLRELADRGHPQAPGWIALLTALLAPTETRIRAALGAPGLVPSTPLNAVQDWLHAHIVLGKLGDCVAAERLARRAMAHEVTTMQAVSRCALLESFRLRGMMDEAEQVLPDLIADLKFAKVLTSPELVTSATIMLDLLGRHDEAADLLDTFRSTVDRSPVAWGPIAGALAAAFHEASVGNEEQTRVTLAPIVALSVVNNHAVLQVSAAALPLLYVLAPSVRRVWDTTAPAGCFADSFELAAALVGLRERRTLADVTTLRPAACRVAAAVLPAPWAAELAVAMIAAGRAEGHAVLARLGRDARALVRQQLDNPIAPIAAAARKLLRETPALPSDALTLRVLGPVELRRNGTLVTAPDLRRERVRQLLAHLIIHGQPSRASIMADLWPDLDERAANRNLRVTLSYLQHVLEPGRSEDDAPYFVRVSGATLHLVVGDALDVDAVRFESLLDDAARLEQQGVLSSALAAYEQATELWDGDLFADVGADDWLQFERERLRGRFVSAAVRAGNLLLARGDATKAQRLAERALHVDRWSERAYQVLIAAHLAVSNLVEARYCLQRCLDVLDELGAPADARTCALMQQLGRPEVEARRRP